MLAKADSRPGRAGVAATDDFAVVLRALLPDAVAACVATPDMYDAPLFPQEQACVTGAVAKRAAEFAAGRASAREALAALGVAPLAIPRTPSRAPMWPAGFVGSITHCAGFCGSVAAPTTRLAAIGLDAESAAPMEPRLANFVCRSDERAAFADLGPPPNGDWAKVAFSAKEAVYKAYSPLAGAFLEFHDVALTFSRDGVRSGGFKARLRNPAKPGAHVLEGLEGRWAICGPLILTTASLVATPSLRLRP
jgi:4'-phosphopantetheinyl transferase EntD